MARERYAVDVNLLVKALFDQQFPDATVAVASDVDLVDRLPFIIVNAGQGVRVQSNSAGIAWSWNVHITILGDDLELVSDLADEIDEYMHSFGDSWDVGHGRIDGVGAIGGVEDISIPTKTAQAETPAGGLVQFDGTYTVLVTKA
jgi:hypothetical protein